MRKHSIFPVIIVIGVRCCSDTQPRTDCTYSTDMEAAWFQMVVRTMMATIIFCSEIVPPPESCILLHVDWPYRLVCTAVYMVLFSGAATLGYPHSLSIARKVFTY